MLCLYTCFPRKLRQGYFLQKIVVLFHTHSPPTRAMTIREIGGIRGFRRPIETVGTSRVSRNVDLIAGGGGIGRRRAPLPTNAHWTQTRFFVTIVLYVCLILQLLYLCAAADSSSIRTANSGRSGCKIGKHPEITDDKRYKM